jgi:hypothetical protein
MLKKKVWANFQRIIELFTQKIVTKLSKTWVWDPGSEIRGSGIKKPIPDPGSQGSKRHRISDPDPQHCCNEYTSIDTVMYSTLLYIYIGTWG